jgi:hypothetical protein
MDATSSQLLESTTAVVGVVGKTGLLKVITGTLRLSNTSSNFGMCRMLLMLAQQLHKGIE